jgi:hypothetical protein
MPPRTSTSPWRHTRRVTHFMPACSTALALPIVILGSTTDAVASARGMRGTASAAADTRANPTTGSKGLGIPLLHDYSEVAETTGLLPDTASGEPPEQREGCPRGGLGKTLPSQAVKPWHHLARRQSSCHSWSAPGSMKRCTLRRGRQRGRFSPRASEPVIKFGRRHFEHPLLSPRRVPSLWLGASPGARWIELS